MSKVKMRLLYVLTRQPILLRWALWCRGQLNSELRVMLDHVSRGDVVFDIGANRGYFTQLYSLLVGKRGRVYAFEPVPSTFRVLQERMADRQVIPNVQLVEIALSDTGGSALMHLPGRDDGQASLRPHFGVGSWDNIEPPATFECRQERLDDFVKDQGIERLDFLKCDVEGAELLVLGGAVNSLKRFQPVLYLEISPDWTIDFGYHPAEIIEFLRPLGYDRFFLVSTDQNRPRSFTDEQLKTLTGSANLLCLPIRDCLVPVLGRKSRS